MKITDIIQIVSIAIAIIALFANWMSNKNNNELSGRPILILTCFACGKEIKLLDDNNQKCAEYHHATSCNNTNCNKIHWFDIKNNGKFSAKNVKVSMLTEQESMQTNFLQILSNRAFFTKHMSTTNLDQYKLEPDEIDTSQLPEYFNLKIYIEYKSEYSRKKYKTIYTLQCEKKDNEIYYYYINEDDLTTNKWHWIKRFKAKLAKKGWISYTPYIWLYDF